MQSLKEKTKGFTIIEVMIVLVIAAVIILIVFLAVPALQRNSRNNQRKNDAGRVSSAVLEYKSNNNGAWPPDNAAVTNATGQLSFYQTSEVINAGGLGPAVAASTPDLNNWSDAGNTTLNNVYVLPGVRCNNGNALAVAGTSVAIVYAIEQSSGPRKAACV